ncbi:hypothetical protein ACTMU2_04800 [Cupriavidus basilensis]
MLRRALHPSAQKRQEALSEFVQDRAPPGVNINIAVGLALVERNPVVFWQSTTALLTLWVLLLLACGSLAIETFRNRASS